MRLQMQLHGKLPLPLTMFQWPQQTILPVREVAAPFRLGGLDQMRMVPVLPPSQLQSLCMVAVLPPECCHRALLALLGQAPVTFGQAATAP